MVHIVQLVLIDAQRVEQSRMKIAGANRSLDGCIADWVGGPYDLAAANASAGQPVVAGAGTEPEAGGVSRVSSAG